MEIYAKATPFESENSNLKGLASITLNGQFVVNSIKLMQGENGLFVSMPSYLDRNGTYQDIVFPITADFREQLNSAIIDAYNKAITIESLDEEEPFIPEPKPIKIDASVHSSNYNDNVKASGQITLNEELVVKGVRVVQGESGLFVAMPSYQDSNGEYKDMAFPITAEMHEQLKNDVIKKYNNLGQTIGNSPYKDLAASKEQLWFYGGLNNKFAQKVGAKLDEMGVKWSGKAAATTTITVNKADKDKYQNALAAAVKAESKTTAMAK